MPGADAIDITIRDIIAISFTWYQAHLDLACVVEVSIFPIGLITMLTHPWTWVSAGIFPSSGLARGIQFLSQDFPKDLPSSSPSTPEYSFYPCWSCEAWASGQCWGRVPALQLSTWSKWKSNSKDRTCWGSLLFASSGGSIGQSGAATPNRTLVPALGSSKAWNLFFPFTPQYTFHANAPSKLQSNTETSTQKEKFKWKKEKRVCWKAWWETIIQVPKVWKVLQLELQPEQTHEVWMRDRKPIRVFAMSQEVSLQAKCCNSPEEEA